MSYLDGLNDEQKKAVLYKEGPLLVVAGAGTGKTRVITARIAHLIREGVAPRNILAVTFTNKAAQEMRERIGKILGLEKVSALPYGITDTPFVGTFHSLGAAILREKGVAASVPQRFAIADRDDARSLIKAAVKDAGLDPSEQSPGKFQGIISREKGNLTARSDFEARAVETRNTWGILAADVWRRYEVALAKEKLLDFDDLLMKAVRVLEDEADLAHFRERWQFILIDEYQDTNHAQYIMARLLVQPRNNITAVGDTDQTIYSWRGARIKNMLRFEKDYPGTKTVFLEENYRSTEIILAAANSVIAQNSLRVEKNLFTRRAGGDKIELCVAPSGTAEAEYVAERARELTRQGLAAEEIAVLYRANFQSRAIEEAFVARGIPYHVSGVKFFDRKEVKDTLAYVRAALDQESLHDLKRIINMPPRGIGKVTIAKLFSGKYDELPLGMRTKIDAVRATLSRIEQKSHELPLSKLIGFVVRESGLETHWKNEGIEGAERIENAKELMTVAARYEHLPPEEALQKFLEDAALSTHEEGEGDDKKRGVQLMTIHAAKGLEFEAVFVTGLEEGLFPHEYFPEADRDQNEHAEEERRLFYVAITRAARKLFLSYAEMRMVFGNLEINTPSSFLADIDPSLIEVTIAQSERSILLD